MSYCGTCGSGYYPECPHRGDGRCCITADPFLAEQLENMRLLCDRVESAVRSLDRIKTELAYLPMRSSR